MMNLIKKNIKFIILMLVVIIFGIVGIAYAIKVANFNPIGLNVTTSPIDVNITYDSSANGASITSSGKMVPIDDSLITGVNVTDERVIKAKFNVAGVSSNPDNTIYDVALRDINIDCDLRTEDVKWRLYKNGTLLTSGNLSPTFDVMSDNRLVLTDTQQDLTTTTDEYVFLLWISESCTGDISTCSKEQEQNKYLNKFFSASIKLEMSTKAKKTLVRNTASADSCSFSTTSVPVFNSLTYNGSEQTLINSGTGYTLVNNTGTNAGEYVVTAKLNNGYKWSDGTTNDKVIKGKINKKKATIVASDQSISYGGSINSTKYTTLDFLSGHSVSSVFLNTSTVDVGVGTITPTSAKIVDANGIDATDNYNLSYVSGTLTIGCSSSSNITVDLPSTLTYGNSRTYTYTVNPTNLLVSCTSSDTSIATCSVDTTNKTVTITPKGTGSVNITLNGEVPNSNDECSSISTSKAITINCSNTATEPIVTSSQDYTGSIRIGISGGTNVDLGGTLSATNVGTYTGTATPSKGYCWSDNTNSSKSYNWTISKIADPVTVTSTTATYDGNTHAATAKSVSGTAVTLTYYSDSSCTIKTNTTNANSTGGAPKNAGTYYAIGETSGTNNYNASISSCTKAVTINKASPTISLSATSGSVSYNSTNTFTATTKSPISSNVAGTLTATSADTSYVTITGGASSSITATSSGVNTTITYKGVKGTNNSTSITLEFTPTDTTNFNTVASTYSVTAVNKIANTLSVAAKTGLSYNGSAQTLATVSNAQGTVYYSTSTELTSSNYSSGSTTISTGTKAGTYTVYYYTPGNDNYQAKSGSVSVTIAKVSPTISLSATSGSVSYNSTNTFTATTKSPISSNVAGTLTATSGGTSYVTITGGASSSITATSSGVNTTITYKGVKGTTSATSITVKFTPSDTTNFNTVTSTYSVTAVNKISSTCTISETPTLKYPGSKSGIFGYSCTGDGSISLTSSNTSVISVGTIGSNSTTLTANAIGSSTLTLKQNEGTNYLASSSVTKSITVSASTYTITYNNNGGSGCSTTSVTYGGTYGTMCEPTRRGYIFIGWFDENYKDKPLNYYADTYSDLKNAFGYDADALYNHYITYGKGEGRRISQYVKGDSFTGNANKTIYAGWYAQGYTISYNSNGGTGSMASDVVKMGGTATIKANEFTKKGYTFAGWTTKSDGTDDGYGWTGWSGTWDYVDGQYGIANNTLKLYARWTPKSYTISYNSNGGTGTMASDTVSTGGKATIKSNTFTRTGYKFVGWTTKSDGTDDGYGWTGWSGTWNYDNGQYGIANNSLVLYARWDNHFTVTYNDNGGSGCSSSSKTVTYGSTYGNLCTPTREGYIFVGWFDSSYKNAPLNYYANQNSSNSAIRACGTDEVCLYNYYYLNGGELSQYTSSSTYNTAGNQTVYAGWVKFNYYREQTDPLGSSMKKCKNGYYNKLVDAVCAGAEVTVLNDVTESSDVTLTHYGSEDTYDNIDIKLNNHTITVPSITFDPSEIGAKALAVITGPGTIKYSASTATDDKNLINVKSGRLSIKGGTYTSNNYSSVIKVDSSGKLLLDDTNNRIAIEASKTVDGTCPCGIDSNSTAEFVVRAKNKGIYIYGHCTGIIHYGVLRVFSTYPSGNNKGVEMSVIANLGYAIMQKNSNVQIGNWYCATRDNCTSTEISEGKMGHYGYGTEMYPYLASYSATNNTSLFPVIWHPQGTGAYLYAGRLVTTKTGMSCSKVTASTTSAGTCSAPFDVLGTLGRPTSYTTGFKWSRVSNEVNSRGDNINGTKLMIYK